jgi:hypothetical protein
MSWTRLLGCLLLLGVVALSGCCHGGRCSSGSSGGCSGGSCPRHVLRQDSGPADAQPERLARLGS